MIVPTACKNEAGLLRDPRVLLATSLGDVAAYLCGNSTLPVATTLPPAITIAQPDLRDVQGQALAKRALEIAATGGITC